MEILLNVFKYLLQVLVERDEEIEALKKDIPAPASDKILDEIRALCCKNLKYRISAGGYNPTASTRVFEKIINIIDTDRMKRKRKEVEHGEK